MDDQRAPLIYDEACNNINQNDRNNDGIPEQVGRPESVPNTDLFKGRNPFRESNIFMKIFFSWVSPLIRFAQKNQLHNDHMGDLQESDSVQHSYKVLKQSWKRYENTGDKNGLFKAVLHANRRQFMLAIAVNFVASCLDLCSPFLIKRIIDFITYKEEETGFGILLVVLLVITQFTSYAMMEHLNFYQTMIGVKSTNALVSYIYRKQLKVSSATNKKYSQGEIVTFVQVDARKLQQICQDLASVAKLPVIIIVCTTFLFYYLGVSFFSGVAVYVVAFIVNLYLGKLYEWNQKILMSKQDARVNVTTEVLNNIKMLKLYSWTNYFENLIDQKRNDEMKTLFNRLCFGIISITSFYFFPQILGAVVFSTYIGTGNTLDIGVAFTVLTIFNLLREPIVWLPDFIAELTEFVVSMRRIQDFIMCDEVNKTIIEKKDFEETQNAVEINSGNFHWGVKQDSLDKKDDFEVSSEDKNTNQKSYDITEHQSLEQQLLKENSDTNTLNDNSILTQARDNKTLNTILQLRGVNLSVRHGEFICVIGDVGSGKSSLLNSIIGDLLYLEPTFIDKYRDYPLNEELISEIQKESQKRIRSNDAPIKIAEKLAYVQQTPWIQNKTIRENILFGLPFDEDKFRNTIEVCELERDLEILPGGDMTEIGEKGINLSGGQKARVSLARAVYSDSSIILMDDPISALDANVKKKIFVNVFMNKFRNKTRILVTHAVDFLHIVDRIVLLKKGEIILDGKYEDIKDSKYLQEMIAIHKSHSKHDHNINMEQNDQQDTIQNIENQIDSDQESLDSDNSDMVDDSTNKQLKKKGGSKGQRTYSLTGGTNNAQQKIGKMIEDENLEETTVKFDVYKKYLKYYGGWKVIVFTQVAMVGFMAFKILSDFQVGNWAVEPDQHEQFSKYCGLIFFFSIMTTLFVFFRSSAFQLMSWRATKQLHKDMMQKVLNAPINLYFDVTPIGRILNKFSKDLQVVEMQLCYSLGSMFSVIYQCIAVILISVIAVPWLLLVLPFIFFLAFKLYRHQIQAFRECIRIESVTKSPLLSYLAETYNGASTIRAFGKNKDFIRENDRLLNKNIIANMWQSGVAVYFSIRMDMLSVTIMAFTCTFCILLRQNSNAVLIALTLNYILQLQDLILWSVKMVAYVEAKFVNVDRLLKVLDIPQEESAAQAEYQNFFEERPNWPEHGVVEFDDVVLKYRPNTEVVLRNLSFKIRRGEKIGVVGRTGAGKSTICLSLSRIVEIAGGSILVDGVDIKSLALEDVRSKITVIPQDPTMFTGSLRFNLDPDNRSTDDRIIQLLKAAKLEELIYKDEKGIHQNITENGSNLSSGEKQLICICRAILRNSKIVVLDEATANIDIVTEKKIQELIALEFTESTMITIAHRLNTIISSDRVLVLSYGQIKEYDTPAALMQNPDSEFTKLLKELKKEEKENSTI